MCTKYFFIRCTRATNLEAWAPQLECLGAQRAPQNFYSGDQLWGLGALAKIFTLAEIFLRAQPWMQKLCLFGHVGRDLHKSEDNLTQFNFKMQSLQGHWNWSCHWCLETYFCPYFWVGYFVIIIHNVACEVVLPFSSALQWKTAEPLCGFIAAWR